MRIVHTIGEVREEVKRALGDGRQITLVPTMGALHAAHQELIRHAKRGEGLPVVEQPRFVVVSIFVNPTQFGPNEDYRAYPRDLQNDSVKAEEAGADLIFSPEVVEMYPPDSTTMIETGELSEGMCGKSRPGHFRGVATVVCKLFNIVQPDAAYFGQKDYQQLKVIERMVQDLHLPVQIVSVPTVREPDGLAMSSRNAYLSGEERRAATILSKALFSAQAIAVRGQKDAKAIIAEAIRTVSEEPLVHIDYIELRDAETLGELQELDRPAVLAMAARVGRTRLIDNVIIKVP